jgi:hypothetical protein
VVLIRLRRQGGNKPLEEEESEFFDILREAERERQRSKQAADERELQSFHVRLPRASAGRDFCLSVLLQLLREQALLKKAVEPSLAAPRPVPPPPRLAPRLQTVTRVRGCIRQFLPIFSHMHAAQPRETAVLIASKRPREEPESTALAGLAAYGSDSE